MANRKLTPLLFALAASGLLAKAPAPAAAQPLWNDLVRVPVPGSVHPTLARLVPVAQVDPELAMDRMLFVLKMSPDAKAQLDQLLRDQQDPASPSFHQWLTPDDFGNRFGPSQAQLAAATQWLAQQGFTVNAVAHSGLTVEFSGTAAQVGKAFRTAMVEYDVAGVRHRGNATGISIPEGLADFVSGVASLNDMRRTSEPHRQALPASASPQIILSDGSDALGPGDFAKIYNLAPLFAQNLTGSGVTIAVVGRTDMQISDWRTFATNFSLTGLGPLTVIHNGTIPGIVSSDEEFEADVDTQWSTATAPGAAIDLVVSASSATTDGADLSAQYIVDHNLAPVVSMSFSSCESALGPTSMLLYDQLWAQAAAQGMSVFVSSGDSGPAGCDSSSSATGTVKAVNGLASTIYDTSVGGTMFHEGTGTYWSTKTSGTQTSALGYIPEIPWDESGSVTGGQGLWAGGGGASSTYGKPSWQSVLGVPADTKRDLPDVSFNAAGVHDPYLVYQGGSLFGAGGTSVATPCMAGIMALVIQRQQGIRQGNANFTLYSLGRSQYNSNVVKVFNDVTSGSDSVPGVPGYTATQGYDLATGLGSLDATALVNNWVKGANPVTASISTPATATVTVASGGPVTFIGAGQDSVVGSNLTYVWNFGDGSANATVAAPPAHIYTIQGQANQTFTATFTVSDGTYVQSSSVQVTVTPAGVSAFIALPVTNVSVLPGIPITFTADKADTETRNPNATISSYSWNFGDGTNPVSGSTVTHTFAENATTVDTVTLTATDSTGATGLTTLGVIADLGYALDVNGDGSVDVTDLLALAAAWNPNLQATAANLNGVNLAADLNGDGVVNDLDLTDWINNCDLGVQ
jgi:subtilase family serine protease